MRLGAMARLAPTTRRASARRERTIAANGKSADVGPLEERVDLRVGLVLSARRHEEAEKLVRARRCSRDVDAR